MDVIVGHLRTIDPKLVAAGVTFLGTKIVLDRVPVDLEKDFIPGYVSQADAIAVAAGTAAGWWKSNMATQLREVHDSGNPDEVLVQEKLGAAQ